MSVVVNSAVRSASGDSSKTENPDDGKAKSRDTRATNCKVGMRDRPANCFILGFLVGVAILGFNTCQFFNWSLHTNPFSHKQAILLTMVEISHTFCMENENELIPRGARQ